MIDFNNLNERELSRIGIAFETPEETKLFSDFVKEQLEVKIGESISFGLSDSLLQEFDMITDEEESAKWLEKNRPNYKEIVNREQHQIVWAMLCLREKISTAALLPQPDGIDAKLSEIGISNYTLKCLASRHVKTVREVLFLQSFYKIPWNFKYYQIDAITKIVDYILSDDKQKKNVQNNKRQRLHPLIDFFDD